ncbi:hypothetical protein [Gandjariella thermophila]|uniref:DoxX family protein n=1 Tax=Gandjariella thermophila TaxID=1931992 RepID=A0A4D4JEX9_9PSEU|nr:hypothetical protein [Gandjariella thermophila]GDY33580.1 hypothetical protein GTS_52130 [Gandjariella thermophila]
MRSPIKIRHLPGRLAAGAFILNSGLSKRNADEETAKSLHGMAAEAYPFLGSMEPTQFVKLLSTTEIALGVALLVPVLPTGLVALALSAFSGGLVGLYLRVPGMREQGSLKPTQQGLPLAKDSWLLGIGTGLVLDSLGRRREAKRAG